MIKRHQIENIVPLSVSLISLILIFNYYSISLNYFSGLLFASTGNIIWWLGKLRLGDAFYDVLEKPNAKRLITTGVYSKIRHPIYLGMILVTIGWALLFNFSIMYLLTVGFVVFLLIKMHIEDKFLSRKFRQKWQNYRKNSWF